MPSEARADRHCVDPLRRLNDRVCGAGQQPAQRVLRQGPLHRLEEAGLEDRQRRLRHAYHDVTRVGAEGRERGEHRCAGQARRPADDEHRARAVLRALAPLARHLLQDLGGDELVLVLAW